jgi:lipopolysaccharide/colanic/teichoic acid biosynthesis glycosyltransferase
MTRKHSFYEKYIKRILDFLLSLFALIVLSIPMLAVAILVRIKLGAPVIFCQERPGKNEKIFKLYKFRTMTDARDENGELLPDEVRLTKFGKFLRSTSLDELPELFNIFLGQMSIVGPRPLLIEYLPLYNEQQKRRHDVRPGLTGYAQVKGRNNICWEERIKYDVEYIKTYTFLKDIEIIFRTVLLVLKKEGTDVKAEYRGVDRFSKHYVPESEKEKSAEGVSAKSL